MTPIAGWQPSLPDDGLWVPSLSHSGRWEYRVQMAEHGEWNRKGATLSDVNAEKEYGITRDFIVAGIRAGKLEYREGAVWGNPYLRIIRSQLERYIEETLGRDQFLKKKAPTELRAINKELTDIRKRITELEARKAEFERALKT